MMPKFVAAALLSFTLIAPALAQDTKGSGSGSAPAAEMPKGSGSGSAPTAEAPKGSGSGSAPAAEAPKGSGSGSGSDPQPAAAPAEKK